MRRCAVVIASIAALALAGCSDDDSDGAAEDAERYALEVEAISDTAYESAQDALVTLNELADGSSSLQAGSAALRRSARRLEPLGSRLAELSPPDDAQPTADDLEFQLDSLARNVDSVRADVDATARGVGSLPDAARAGARVVLASQSGMAALSRALRFLAEESAD